MGTLPTLEELRPAYEKALDMVRTYIQGEELAKAFEEIRTAHKIHFDEAGKLSLALNAVFLEVRPAGEFSILLKESLEQNSDKYGAILNDVNEKIFKVFRAKMERKESGETEPVPAPIPAVRQPPPVPAQKTPQERLSSTTSQGTERVSLKAPEEKKSENEPRPASSSSNNYSDGDPYRESVE